MLTKVLTRISYKNYTRGFSVVEVLLSSTVFILLVTALVGAYLYGEESTMLGGNRVRATMLAEEGLEATRNIRDAAFSSLSDGTFGLATTSNEWNLSGSSDSIDIFNRTVLVSMVSANRKSITSNVAWQQNAQRSGSVTSTTYLTNWQRVVSAVGDWSTTTLDATLDFSGTNDGRKVQVIGNYAYVVGNDGTPDFLIIDVTTPSSPSLVGSLSLTGAPTNVYVSGNYAYISSSDNAGELKIIDITTKTAPVLIGNYNASGNNDGNGVYIVGTTAYLVRTNAGSSPGFLIIDVSIPGTPSLVGSLNMAQIGYEVVISGNYAFVSSGDNGQELKVINITTPTTPVLAGSLNLSGNTDAITIAITGSILYMGQGSNLYSVDISTPTAPIQLGTLSVVDILNDIALNLGNGETYLFIATSDNANEFKVIDVAVPALPSILGQRNITGNNPLFGVAYDVAFDRAFLVGAADAWEFIIIAPQ